MSSFLRFCTSSVILQKKTIETLFLQKYKQNVLSMQKLFFEPQYNKIGIRNYAASTNTIIKNDQNKKDKKFTIEDEADILNRLKTLLKEEELGGDIVPIFKKALLYGHKTAIKDNIGEYSYNRLYIAAKKLSYQISNLCGSGSSNRVAFLCPNDVMYPLFQWSIWISGQIAVPLSYRHPPELIKYFIKDSKCNVILTTPDYEKEMRPLASSLNCILVVVEHSFIPEFDVQNSWLDPKFQNIIQLNEKLVIEGTLNSDYYTNKDAMILYTSGTTGNPKGVVLSHKNINSQVSCLLSAWQFNNKDTLLHVLPLHHVHGCVNALMCPLSIGGKVIMHESFNSHNVWSALLGINTPAKHRANIFMGVPTIYNFLIDEYDKIFAKNSRMVEYIENHCKKNIRLMVSGSAPLPSITFNRWFEISGHRLLERYGMTEIGMALSNPYVEDKVRSRKPGCVGLPLPGVEVKIVDSENKSLFECKGEEDKGFWSKQEHLVYSSDLENKSDQPISGQLYVKGDNVFTMYYNNLEETQKSFDGEYFKTGDVVSYENGVFKILGRLSSDIIKTGGYKVSALQIETHILNHPSVKDVAVVGVDDITWGQSIAVVISVRSGAQIDLEKLKKFCSEKLPNYALPTMLKVVEDLPRNAMGKINKKELINTLFASTSNKQQKVENKVNEPKIIQNEQFQFKQQQSVDISNKSDKKKTKF